MGTRWADIREFDEEFYCRYYEDVGRAVANKQFKSGRQHYLLHGRREGRLNANYPAKILYQKIRDSSRPTGLARLGHLEERLEPVPVEVDVSRPPVTNVFIPSLEPLLMFGGYIAFFHFLCRLREAGTVLRFIVMEDPQSHLAWFLAGISDRPRWALAFSDCEVVNLSSRESRRDPLLVSPLDAAVAYSCWMAHACKLAASASKCGKFLFFVQEYEPAFHHHDSVHFIVNAAYHLPHVPLFNSRTLHDYFRDHGIGVFKTTVDDQLTFEHVITKPSPSVSLGRFRRRMLFYARPEAHAGRNLFEIGILALRECARRGCLKEGWELIGIGSAEPYEVEISQGVVMDILPRVSEREYEEFIRGFDIGLSLISTPHPGVVHFEWAAAGMLTVVNTTRDRNASYFAKYGTNIVAAEPSVSGIADAIERSIAMVEAGRHHQTVDLSSFSSSWDEAFSTELVARVIAQLKMPLQVPSDRNGPVRYVR